MEKIFFNNSKGKRLCGILHEPKGKAAGKAGKPGKLSKSGSAKAGSRVKAFKDDRAVIMLHGFTGDKSEAGLFEKAAAAIAEKGFAVLRFDFTGCGESAEGAICMRDQVEDARAALGFMKSRSYRKFGLLGFSLGGLINLRTRDDAIVARVLWAPLTKSKNVPNNYSIWDKLVLIVTGRKTIEKPRRKWRQKMVIARRFFFELMRINQKKLGEGIDSPTLIIHGDSDTHVPLNFSESMVNFLPKGSRLEVIKGVDHNFQDEVPKLIRLSAEWFGKKVM